MFFFCFLKNIIIVFEDRIRVLKAKSEILKLKLKVFKSILNGFKEKNQITISKSRGKTFDIYRNIK